MALILAVNPGSTQSATLARVARQLHGHELIGADSCAIAMKALDQRMPAIVLLPSAASKGESELLQRLQPSGVPTLRLPPPTSVDPRALADEIRELLGDRAGAAAPNEHRANKTSAHLIAAATAAIDWIRARRATWPVSSTPTPVPAGAPLEWPEPEPVPELEPVLEYAARNRTRKATPKPVETWAPPSEDWPPPPPKAEPAPRRGSAAKSGSPVSREAITAWIPRVIGLAAVVGVIWVGIGYWPSLVATWDSATAPAPAGAEADRSREETAKTTTAAPRAGRGAAAAGALAAASGSGWLAVFSSVELTVSEGSKAIMLDDRSQAMLPAGRHRLRFQNRSLGYDEIRSVQIKSTETTTVNLTPQTTIGVTSNQPAEVSIDGAVVGGTPLRGHRISLGTHTVVVRAAGAERQVSVDATSKPVQIDVDFSKP
jgi:hypothetical protein